MRQNYKKLAELCSIEVAFARAEILAAHRGGAEKARIAKHLNSAAHHLNDLSAMLDREEPVTSKTSPRGRNVA